MKLETLTKPDNFIIQKKIISNIRDLINLKNLEPGDKLPSERMLSEKFDVSRSNVREAIQKLEFYGLLKSMPQSGTFVADLDKTAMNGMIDQILDLPTPDFKSLVETRIFLELKIVKFAAARHTDQNLTDIEEALTNYTTKTLAGEDSVAEDLLFHLAIAKASHNSSLNRLMLSITPQIITDFEKFHVCKNNTAISAIEEHKAIVDAIRKKDPTLAEAKMKEHFTVLYQYCYET